MATTLPFLLPCFPLPLPSQTITQGMLEVEGVAGKVAVAPLHLLLLLLL